MRWLKSSIQSYTLTTLIGCIGSDRFVALMGYDIEMIRQDVAIMLKAASTSWRMDTARRVGSTLHSSFPGVSETPVVWCRLGLFCDGRLRELAMSSFCEAVPALQISGASAC